MIASLDPERVNAIFLDCLFKVGEDTSKHIAAEGIVQTVGFHPGRIEAHREEIQAMLSELPDQFKTSGGGGWSFLQACEDKHGNLWTGLHQRMEQLFQLGIAIGIVEYQLPRNLWSAMPGGMPYVTINDVGEPVDRTGDLRESVEAGDNPGDVIE